MRRIHLKAALVLGAMFVLGAIAGGALTRFLATRWVMSFFDSPAPVARRRFMLWALDRKLHLSSAQRARFEQILESHAAESAQIWRAVEPQARALRRRQYEEARAVLSPAQQRIFDQITEQAERSNRAAIGLLPGSATDRSTPTQEEPPAPP